MTTDTPPGSPGRATGAPNQRSATNWAGKPWDDAFKHEIAAMEAEADEPKRNRLAGTVSPAFLASGAAIQYDGRHPAAANLNTSELTVVQDAQIRRMNATLTTVVQTGKDTKGLIVHMERQIKSLQTSLRITGILTAAIAFGAIIIAMTSFNAR